MTGRISVAIPATLALACLAGGVSAGGQERAAAPRSVDVRPGSMDAIPPGTVIGDRAPRGWTDLILIATPRIGVGDVAEVSKAAESYSGMFRFTVLARVRGDARSGHVLDRVAIGTALKIEDRQVVADSENTFGADLGIIGRHVLAENEKILKEDFRQVARTSTMVVFDAKAFVLRKPGHRSMVLRHVVLVSPATGQVSTFVWLLAPDGEAGYTLADKGLQKLPPAYHEDRVLSVDGRKFMLGIPSNDAFALAKVPQGTTLGFSEALKAVAATRPFTDESARKLEDELQARYAPVATRPRPTTPGRP